MWSLCFGSLATLIIVGNLVTIWIFLKQRLRKRAHFLLISLAVADLLVGLLTVPLYITINTISYLKQPYLQVWPVSDFADIFTGVASIVTLSTISLERMYAIGWPFRHRTLNFRVYMFAIALPWILAAILTSIAILVYILLYHNTEKLCVHSNLISEHASVSDVYSILCCMEETKSNDGESKSHSKREKISKNAIHYYCSFSFDLAVISNIVTVGIFWCNPTLL